MSIRIRDARPDDRDAIVAIVPRLRAFGGVPLYTSQQLDDPERETLERALKALPEDAKLVVAELEGVGVVGVAYGKPETDYFTRETHGYLDILAVAEAGEGKGVGRALVDAIEAWSTASGHRFLALNVFDANARARAFYEKAGFAPLTIRCYKNLSGQAS